MLKGNGINLRLVREKDLDAYYDLTHDVEARGNYYPLTLTSESAMRKRFEEGGYWSDQWKVMLIVDAASDRILGTAAAFKPVFYQDSLELAYILYEVESRGKGIVTEAVRLFTDYLFRLENIFRLQIQVETDNKASRKVAEKSGFHHEGTLRDVLLVGGKPTNMEMYSMTRSDWEARNS
jgi:RimJ/RimL family protein N-acetyltransferase